MELRVSFRTLGCKLNQVETESLAEAFRIAGAALVDGSTCADLYVVNTCTVTSRAEQKARRAVRLALASSPGSVALITGCYAQMDPEGLSLLHERAIVVPGNVKDAVLGLASWLAERWQGQGDLIDAVRSWTAESLCAGSRAGPAAGGDRFAFHPRTFAFHSRPSLKIQDGCDNRCAYCRVCLARGPSSSLPLGEAIERVRALEEAGAAELVLTGVNLSQYRDGKTGFPGLLRTLIEKSRSIAFRLSSYEPDRVDEDFLEAFAHPRVRPHLHLPVQSGSDAVLARMGRAYARDRVLVAAENLRHFKGDPFLAADIIVGFPGESAADFEETARLCESCGFAWIHAFPFSPRPGTGAESMRPRVPERVAGERVRCLAAIAGRGRGEYLSRWLGSEVDVVLEKGSGLAAELDGEVSQFGTPFPIGTLDQIGTSENYLKMKVEGLPLGLGPGRAVRCRIDRSCDGGLAGIDGIAVFLSEPRPVPSVNIH